MKPKLFLRIAAVVAIVQAILHTIGGVYGTPEPGAAAAAVAAMKANHFPVTGLDRTYWDFFMGFGLGITIFLVIEGVVFWILGSMAAKDGVDVRPILMAFVVGYAALTVLAYRYFFFAPMLCDALVGMCLAIAAFAAKPAHVTSAVASARA
jgi:hypothetical protein